MKHEWAQGLRMDSRMFWIPFFMKQLGGHPDKRDKMEGFPDVLRIREFPPEIVNDKITF
jgi:hypothetical protein